MQVLVADEPEELVLDKRAAESAACRIAMQLGILVSGGYVVVFFEEEGRSVEKVCAAVAIKRAVDLIASRLGAHIDMCAAVGSLLGVIHRGIHAHFRDGFGRGRWDGVAEIGRASCRERV